MLYLLSRNVTMNVLFNAYNSYMYLIFSLKKNVVKFHIRSQDKIFNCVSCTIAALN